MPGKISTPSASACLTVILSLGAMLGGLAFLLLGQFGSRTPPDWPMPKLMSNEGCYIVSMGNVCRWLAEQAEALGVEIFPGMAASALVFDGDRVAGVVAGEFGLEPDGTPGPSY